MTVLRNFFSLKAFVFLALLVLAGLGLSPFSAKAQMTEPHPPNLIGETAVELNQTVKPLDTPFSIQYLGQVSSGVYRIKTENKEPSIYVCPPHDFNISDGNPLEFKECYDFNKYRIALVASESSSSSVKLKIYRAIHGSTERTTVSTEINKVSGPIKSYPKEPFGWPELHIPLSVYYSGYQAAPDGNPQKAIYTFSINYMHGYEGRSSIFINPAACADRSFTLSWTDAVNPPHPNYAIYECKGRHYFVELDHLNSSASRLALKISFCYMNLDFSVDPISSWPAQPIFYGRVGNDYLAFDHSYYGTERYFRHNQYFDWYTWCNNTDHIGYIDDSPFVSAQDDKVPNWIAGLSWKPCIYQSPGTYYPKIAVVKKLLPNLCVSQYRSRQTTTVNQRPAAYHHEPADNHQFSPSTASVTLRGRGVDPDSDNVSLKVRHQSRPIGGTWAGWAESNWTAFEPHDVNRNIAAIDVSSGREYRWQVKARDSGGEGAWTASRIFAVSVATPTPVPPTPTPTPSPDDEGGEIIFEPDGKPIKIKGSLVANRIVFNPRQKGSLKYAVMIYHDRRLLSKVLPGFENIMEVIYKK